MAKDSDALVVGLGSDVQWVKKFQLLDKSGAEMFSVDPATGNVAAHGTVTSAGAIDGSGNLTITNSAPFLLLSDNTASAKSLKIKADANQADLRETAGADGSLLVLDLANNRVGIGAAPGAYALDVTGAAHGSSTLLIDGNFTVGAGATAVTVTAASGNTDVGGTLGVDGAAALDSTLSVGGNITASAHILMADIEAALTAKGGGGQDSSATSTHAVAIVATVSAGNDSFTLPAATGSGRVRLVSNQAAANSMQLFGLGSDTVNAANSGTGVAVAAKKNALCVDYASGKWFAVIG